MGFDLHDYNFPEDIKKMSPKELELLSVGIRDFLIDKVSKSGGHIASNLGIVELTIALHKVFDSPRDKFIWDVGHQSYVHKILTGRIDEFDKLRQYGGISGFPKRKESEHDIYETGHSSTSISAAFGLAKARDLKQEKSEVVAIIGDGALTGGMAYEALNNIGASKSKMIIVLNDNGMSISSNIGSVSEHLVGLRTSKSYLGTKRFARKQLGRTNIGKTVRTGVKALKQNFKYLLINRGGVLFEELGFTYLGPIDGHDIGKMVEVMNRAKNVKGPVVIHAITQKGKGYKLAEQKPNKFHGISSFDPETGECLNKKNSLTYSEIMGNKVLELAKHDERIVAISAAMTEATGLLPFAQRFPRRFFDVGIAEEHAVTFAAGLAIGGMKPLVAIYSSFLQRAYDQIIEDVCLQNLPVVFAIDRAGVVGVDGETHHGVFDISYLTSIPNLTVLAPRDATQLEEMLEYAFRLETPVAIRYPRGESIAYDDGIKFEGHNIRISEGNDVDIWAVGTMYQNALSVKELLEKKGYSVGFVNVNNISAINDKIDKKVNKKAKLYVTIEDNIASGGFGQKFDAHFVDDDIDVINFAWEDKFIEHGTVLQLQENYGLTPIKIVERIVERIERKA